jgi:hypothetical protein
MLIYIGKCVSNSEGKCDSDSKSSLGYMTLNKTILLMFHRPRRQCPIDDNFYNVNETSFSA